MFCVLTFATPSASAQRDNLTGKLTAGVVCTVPGAEATLRYNISKAAAAPSDIASALNAIVGDPTACGPMRDAASKLAASITLRTSADAKDRAPAASSKIIADALAEAERRAANMKFEVGPPPAKVTRGRNPGL